ncbi:probable glycosyltransferase At5g03795 [Juglans microcarpa x Juglans regia]|uniref:probable glycosyltransferase At5g03795 n=1 Tax=Juglans microcarpa x Juglans regia TaxID=2249226 RepID=UPI001B7F074B|nr:probable glycosyltransferase At5g03795 [Juglans microcarpa x Juglans regia]
MKKSLWRIAAFLMKELIYRCERNRVDWRKLSLFGAMLTVAGVVFQMFTLPYSLNMWFLLPPATVSLSGSMNGTIPSSEARSEARAEQFQLVPTVPIVSVNSSLKLIQSMPVEPKKVTDLVKRKPISRRRKKNIKPDDKSNILSPPPPHKTVPSRFQRYIWSLPPNEALVYAKKEIEHTPVVVDDPDLFAPLFQNVSVFRRSYELMEMILKVFIYPDGARPIFHQPHLKGIYASEGWFMRLMEGNRQFTTRDPEKAHLFYLPYSARQLEMALYVPRSHNMKPLSIFLRDYVNMIAAKYPFWNRTHGADHFLVACHDWGPYTVTEHEELSKNTIKALCNADLSEGIFVAGKDVSLPETTIRTPRKPLRNVGGNRVSQRPFLAFFAGNMHGRVRPTLLKYWRDKDEDMKIYGPLPVRVSRKMSYVQHMKSSKYCICPMGYEVNSPRIVEAIYYECVPVIIADNFVLPFSEVLDWSSFSVVVTEKDIPKLKEILMAIPMRRYLKMQINVKMVQKHFLWNPRPIRYDLFHMILHSIWFNRLKQIQVTNS